MCACVFSDSKLLCTNVFVLLSFTELARCCVICYSAGGMINLRVRHGSMILVCVYACVDVRKYVHCCAASVEVCSRYYCWLDVGH